MTSIYAAGAIDLRSSTDTNAKWRDKLQAELQRRGLVAVVYDPSGAFKLVNPGAEVTRDIGRSKYIEEVNNMAIDQAAIFVALVDKNIGMIGTPIEIDRAHSNLKRMVVLTNIKPGGSVYLDNRTSPGSYIYNSLEDMDSALYALADWIEDALNRGIIS